MTSNRTPNTTEQHNVTVQQAARILGITDEAVRARIRRGKLAGEKRGGTWVVSLSDEEGQGPTQQNVTQQPTQQAQQHTPGDRDVLVEYMQEEIAYLRERLEEADRQRDHLQHQLADERRRTDTLTALSAAVSAPDEAPDPRHAPGTENAPTGILARLRSWLTGER